MKMNDGILKTASIIGVSILLFSMNGCVGLSYPALANVEEGQIEWLEKERKITIVSEKEIEIATTPSGAAVLLDGFSVGTTPVSIKYPLRGDGPLIEVFLDGYEPISFRPEKKRLYRFDRSDPKEIEEITLNTIVGIIMLTPWHGVDYIQWREELDCDFSPKRYDIQLIEK